MTKNRRLWLKQMGLGIVGLSIGQLKAFVSPTPALFNPDPTDIPIRLDLNENPYGPSPLARVAMLKAAIEKQQHNWD